MDGRVTQAARAPWYAAGLRFSCRRCGRCCTGEAGYVWVTDAEAAAIAAELGVDPDDFRRRYMRKAGAGFSLRERANGDCVLLRPGEGCLAYRARPVQCRTFPFWPENVQTEEDRRTTVFAVELSVDDPQGKLKPGMPADVTFEQ